MQLLFVLALLIGNTAAGLASRLTGSLALAATAVLGTLTQIASLDGLDVFHSVSLHFSISGYTLSYHSLSVNHIFHTFHTLHFHRTQIAAAIFVSKKRRHFHFGVPPLHL